MKKAQLIGMSPKAKKDFVNEILEKEERKDYNSVMADLEISIANVQYGAVIPEKNILHQHITD